jgi:tellurite resistance protein TehA-like permease
MHCLLHQLKFPGCFYCDKKSLSYNMSLNLHLGCSAFAGLLAFVFLSKLVIARNIFFEELSNPVSIAPAGLICMTLSVAFAGRGIFGMWVVLVSSAVHLCLALWFVYMALAYRMMPDPSWFPNTVGVGISAVKAWLYYPIAGRLLMAVRCLWCHLYHFLGGILHFCLSIECRFLYH